MAMERQLSHTSLLVCCEPLVKRRRASLSLLAVILLLGMMTAVLVLPSLLADFVVSHELVELSGRGDRGMVIFSVMQLIQL